jgi:DNA-binding MarR family transcriptional regulator
MEDERNKLIEQILTLRRTFSRAARPARDWLAVDLTLPQVKVLYLLYSAGRLSMRPLAEALGVALPTLTPIVDRQV